MRSRFLAALVAAVVVGTATPSLAQAAGADIVSVELVSVDGATLTYDGRTYAGPLLVTKHPDGLAITEEAPIEQYLHGIAEMPFAWPSEALAAQAVAARTYLTRRVLGGRSGDEETYRFDICATNRCQVYRGVQYVNGEYGERWRQAVDESEDQILTEAAQMMANRDVEQLPVVREGTLVGFLTRDALLLALQGQTGTEQHQDSSDEEA